MINVFACWGTKGFDLVTRKDVIMMYDERDAAIFCNHMGDPWGYLDLWIEEDSDEEETLVYGVNAINELIREARKAVGGLDKEEKRAAA